MNSWGMGLLGEVRAARYIRGLGMRILKRRYRAAHGEIDLIARDGDTLVFLEVKARPRGRLGEGAAAVDQNKRRRIRYAALRYLGTYPAENIRFDVVEISAAGLRHIKNAF